MTASRAGNTGLANQLGQEIDRVTDQLDAAYRNAAAWGAVAGGLGAGIATGGNPGAIAVGMAGGSA